MKVSLNGRIVDGEHVRLNVRDHGLLYGDGVFEGIRIYNGRVFRLADHLRRLALSAAYIGLELPYSLEGIGAIVEETAAALGKREAYMRLLVTRGAGGLGVDPFSCEAPQVVCMAGGIAMYDPKDLQAGIDMVTTSGRKPPPDVLNPEIKSLNYLNSVMAKREARLRGAQEGLVLNLHGKVAEASAANVFAWTDGALVTPPTVDGALPGITRATVIELARELGIETRTQSIGQAGLMRAEEVFLTGSGARLVPVGRLDTVAIGSGNRPVFERIDKAFREYTSHYGEASPVAA
ncbi:MAG: branched-chain-amino-acid transaminase [Alphaproteobacteria bacterium]|nr:branched-chain-amino-acid transaminase [Alphaproteobacteria bacterium]